MIRMVLRVLVGIAGALGVLVAVRLWMDPAMPAAALGLGGIGELGRASLRADVGGFFGGAGLMALIAAARNDRRIAIAPAILIGLALAGRVFTVAREGVGPLVIQPMAIEAVLLILLLGAHRTFGKG
jgi:hypothetical protein